MAQPLAGNLSDEDKQFLINKLTRSKELPVYKVQILHAPTDKCRRFAKDLSEILSTANWIQPSPPTPLAPDLEVPTGFSLASSIGGPAYAAAIALGNAFWEIGIHAPHDRRADLRSFEYCMLRIKE